MINNNIFIFITLSLLISLAIDVIYGEMPTLIHPVVIIGKLIDFFKKIYIKIPNKISGLLITISMYISTGVILYIIYIIVSFNNILLLIFYSLILTSMFSYKLLISSAIDIKKNLDDNIQKARKNVSYLVSRNTNELTEELIVSATIESMSENITDSYNAVIFYYIIFAILTLIFNIDIYYTLLATCIYRVSNTLDAMLGYKTDELKNIGYVPAKLDDVLNYIPSRISGYMVVIASFLLKYDWKNSYKIMKRDARACPSPNSGYTMASQAGSLNIQLIKKDTYILGDDNKKISKEDIIKASKLTSLSIILFTIIMILLFILIWVIL